MWKFVSLFVLLLPLSCLPLRRGGAGKDFAPLYEMNVAGQPVKFTALRGRGGVTLAFLTRPPQRFVARPIYSASGGELVRLATSDTLLNLGFVPPRKVPEPSRFTVKVDWVVRGPEGYRDSGLTEVILEVSPDLKIEVLDARNVLDPKAEKRE